MVAAAPPTVQRVLFFPIFAEGGKLRNFTMIGAFVTHLNISIVADAPPAAAPPAVQLVFSFSIFAEGGKPRNFATIRTLVTHLNIPMVVRFIAIFFGQWLICKSFTEKRPGHSNLGSSFHNYLVYTHFNRNDIFLLIISLFSLCSFFLIVIVHIVFFELVLNFSNRCSAGSCSSCCAMRSFLPDLCLRWEAQNFYKDRDFGYTLKYPYGCEICGNIFWTMADL
ncbi:hypothetical protein AXF42_Ash015035 [Apostasia shenzhenica]|uniref:Uncharacterized protein n=1 Tax=Apostasia shenzhenica TaxID=1088818 RepID=A0A2I0B2Y3_9ASPA|nr:hypothetical protein AXF42_Ash015035 [Apostasia shenzhenica]